MGIRFYQDRRGGGGAGGHACLLPASGVAATRGCLTQNVLAVTDLVPHELRACALRRVVSLRVNGRLASRRRLPNCSHELQGQSGLNPQKCNKHVIGGVRRRQAKIRGSAQAAGLPTVATSSLTFPPRHDAGL
jgi:hypothetical protein